MTMLPDCNSSNQSLAERAGMLLLGVWGAISLGCSSDAPPEIRLRDPGNPPPVAAEPMEATVEKPRLVDKTFDDIKFEIEPGETFHREMLTPEIEQLAGQRIRIRGYILPTFQRKGIRQFVLVRDDQECCFGPGAALYDCIIVEMLPGESTEFTVKPVAVEGVFSIDEMIGPDGNHWAIYHLVGEAVN